MTTNDGDLIVSVPPAVANAIADSRITRKGRRVAQRKLGINRNSTQTDDREENTTPGAFEVSGRPVPFNPGRWSLERARSLHRIHENRNSGPYQSEENVVEAFVRDDPEGFRPEETGDGGDRSVESAEIEEALETALSQEAAKLEKIQRQRRKVFLSVLVLVTAFASGAIIAAVILTTIPLSSEKATPTQSPVVIFQPMSPTQSVLDLRYLEGFDPNLRVGQSVSLSSDGTVCVFSVPGVSQVYTDNLKVLTVDQDVINVTSYPFPVDFLELSKDGNLLVAVGHGRVMVQRFNHTQMIWELQGLELELVEFLAPSEASIFAISHMDSWTSTGDALYVALALTLKTAGRVMVFQQSLSGWVQKGTDIVVTPAPDKLLVGISSHAQLVVTGETYRGGDLVPMVKIHSFDGIAYVESPTKFSVSAQLHGLRLVSPASKRSVLAYLDGESAFSYDLLSTHGTTTTTMRKRELAQLDAQTRTNVKDLALSRDGNIIVMATQATLESIVMLAGFHYSHESYVPLFPVILLGLEYKGPDDEETVNLAISDDGSTVCIGLPSTGELSLRKKSGTIICVKITLSIP